MRKEVNVERLIKEFSGMAERGTLLTGSGTTQEDLLIQIQGTIVKVAMEDYSSEPTLKNYIARYKMNKQILENHPEAKEMLERKLEETKMDIINYVTGDDFCKHEDGNCLACDCHDICYK